jgi:TRAP-type C4-dicarboxylate transport system permease small subunit
LKGIKVLEKAVDAACFALSFAGACIVFAIMFLICGDVFGRWIFSHPIIGTTEIEQNFTAIIVFLMLPWATKRGEHVRSTMILNRIPPIGAKALNILSYIGGVALFAGVIYSCWTPLLKAIDLGDYEGDLFRFPLTPVWGTIIAASVLCLIQCICKIIRIATNPADNALDGEV